jgi:hypothetical protein
MNYPKFIVASVSLANQVFPDASAALILSMQVGDGIPGQ